MAEAFVTRLACMIDVAGDDADLLQHVLHVLSLFFGGICTANDKFCQLGDDLVGLSLENSRENDQTSTARLNVLRVFFPASPDSIR